jgi:3-oxoacyl-[acyl-carrier-protein] synthase II
MKNRVVVTGMGILTALGRGIAATEKALREGRSGIGEITSFDPSLHKTSLGAEIKDLFGEPDFVGDRASSMVLAACKDAFTSASLLDSNDYSIKAPVILGTTLGGMLSGQQYHRDLILDKNKEARAELLKDYFSCNQAAHISDKFRLLGDALILHNACASGLSAIGCAFHRIQSGSTAIAITGGYDVFSDFTHAGFNSLQLIAPAHCCPFDKNRKGLILGEGAGMLVVEELNYAVKRKAKIFAEIIGYGQSSDAYHITKPDPTAKSAANAITMAIRKAGIKPDEIDYINAHGTGTQLNDAMEAKALHLALGDYAYDIPISSVKPMIGHTLGASGALETIISIIAMNTSMAPENLNYQTPDQNCRLNIISGRARNAEIKTVLSNSFGFGGSNCALVLKKY